MDQEIEKEEKISFNERASKDVAKVGFFIIALVVFLYLLTITTLPIYAR
jgi:hypothetical protein